MSLKISRRVVDDVTILDLCGDLTLPAGGILRGAVKDLLAQGRRKILLNFADVSHIDSAGNGEVVSVLTLIRNSGGSLKFVALGKRVQDLWQITKLYTVFEIDHDEASALRMFSFSRYSICPSCRNVCMPPSLHPRRNDFSCQICITCNAQFKLMFGKLATRVPVEWFRAQTYEREYFEVLPGPPYEVKVTGRLNLFSSSALDKVWRAIPPPRRVIFNIGSAMDIDAPGWEALLAFLEKKESSAKAVISLGSRKAIVDSFRRCPYAYSDVKEALATLGDVSDAPLWLCETVDENH